MLFLRYYLHITVICIILTSGLTAQQPLEWMLEKNEIGLSSYKLPNDSSITEIFCERFEETNSTWNNHTFQTNDYNTLSQLERELVQSWFNSAWIDNSQILFTYDPTHGKVTEQLQQSAINGPWENSIRFSYTYDSNDQLSLFLHQRWGNIGWDDYSRTAYTYDANGRLETTTFDLWTNNDGWVPTTQTTFLYDGAGTDVIESQSASWDAVNAEWDVDGKTLNTYNANGDLEEQITQIWANFSGMFQNQGRWIFSYDSLDNTLTEQTFYQWDNVSTWNPFSRRQYTWSEGGSLRNYLDQWWLNTFWINNRRCSYTYDLITGIAENAPIQDFAISNHPNPFNPQTTITFQLPEAQQVVLSVFDISGRQIETLLEEYLTAGQHTINFRANNLPSGLYFYRLKSDRYSAVGKMVLTR